MYKAFAVGTLIVAPVMVLGVQSILPSHTPVAAQAQPSVQIVAPPVPVPVAPSVGQFSEPGSAMTFGQPAADAGRPLLQATPDDSYQSPESATPGAPLAGSPNAE